MENPPDNEKLDINTYNYNHPKWSYLETRIKNTINQSQDNMTRVELSNPTIAGFKKCNIDESTGPGL